MVIRSESLNYSPQWLISFATDDDRHTQATQCLDDMVNHRVAQGVCNIIGQSPRVPRAVMLAWRVDNLGHVDLYLRPNVFEIHLAPLSDRRSATLRRAGRLFHKRSACAPIYLCNGS